MQITLRQRIRRAQADTSWFSLKSDILAPLVPALVTAVVAYFASRGDEGFNLNDLLLPGGAGVVALVVYWTLVNGVEFAWNSIRAGERIAVEEVARLEKQVGNPDERERIELAISVLTTCSKYGADCYDKALRIWKQPTNRRDPTEWEAAIEACRAWARTTENAIIYHCPDFLGEFDSYEIGGGFFEEGNARRGRLAGVLRQLRLSL